MRICYVAATLLLALGVALVGCGGGKGSAVLGQPSTIPPSTATIAPSPTPTPWMPPVFANAAAPLDIPTYDGSGQVVHPDVVFFPDGWHGHRYWMAITPYPYDTDTRENPSIVVSDDGMSWSAPEGLVNPLVPAPECDHNSDPDIVHNPRTDELYVYYTVQSRAERCPGENGNEVRLVTSPDGVNWSAPRTVMRWNLDVDPLFVSPAVVYEDGVFRMWLASREGVTAQATSEDGVEWSALETVEIAVAPWHLDVTRVEDALVMVLVDSPFAGSCLRVAVSEDGSKWRVAEEPVLRPGGDWDDERIYRSTLLYDEDAGLLRLWYSARSSAGEWHVGYSEVAY